MFTLTNSQLTVEILDPATDSDTFGARYCTGGYIWQVLDTQHGPLLSGPTYPHDFNTFDGQGIPDAFNLHPLRAAADDQTGLIIGVGMCQLLQNWRENEVIVLCEWEVGATAQSVVMATQQAYADWALTLRREVTLLGRTVRATANLSNTGNTNIPLRWFPHPFYPQTNDGELIKLNLPFTMQENPGYMVAENGWVCRKGPHVQGGYFQPLEHQARSPLVIQQRHPALGLITATTSYVPGFFPIWGNAYTFSWEPFLEATVAAGQSLAWWVEYDF
jgi:hypothetical protein